MATRGAFRTLFNVGVGKLYVLGCHALQGIRHVIALVDDLLQKFVKLLPVDIGNRVDLAGPELNPQARQTGVERDHLDRVRLSTLPGSEVQRIIAANGSS